MPNLVKALFVFSCWALVALTSHFLLSKYHSDFCNQLEHLPKKTLITPGTHFYLLSNTKDTIARHQSQNNIFENELLIKNNIDSLRFINVLINKLKNDYKLQLYINFNSNFSTLKGENIFISEVETKFKNELDKPIILNFSANNKIPKNSIDFKLLEKSNQLIDSIEQSIITKTFHLKFENGKVYPSEELTSYSNLLHQYLQNYSEKTISIIGHTNNMGYFENNLTKGLKMANSLKDYFV